MLIAALSATDKATIALASVTGALALVAVLQLIASVRSEARRTQPVAVLHRLGGPDPLTIPVYMTNEGIGTAYNVRVGVKLYEKTRSRRSRFAVDGSGLPAVAFTRGGSGGSGRTLRAALSAVLSRSARTAPAFEPSERRGTTSAERL